MNLRALQSPDFRLYFAGNAFALNAMWMLRVIVAWLAWDLTSSAAFVGSIAFVNFFPSLVLGPIFGVMVDRANVRRAAIGIQSAFAILSIALWGLQLSGQLTEPLLLAYALATGLVMAAHSPVRMSLAPRLVPSEGISSAVNIASINYSVSRMTGPALGGWATAHFGIANSTFIAFVMYLPFILSLSRLNLREISSKTSPDTFFSALSDGIKLTIRLPSIWKPLTISALAFCVVLGMLEILPVVADGVFQKGAAGLGILISAGGLGAVVAGFGLAMLPPSNALNSFALPGILCFVGLASLAGLGWSSSWYMAIATVSVMSAAVSATGIICQSQIQMSIEDNMRGRIMSLWASAAIGGNALGAFVLGVSVESFGLTTALTLAASSAALVLVILLVSGRSRPIM